ncbi:hypothetical protein FRC06_004150 [Ceratobasidium sp. 370]|nr:hypothetical protein FRC06_004150 [Ceratobasidium sp. 370]
MAKATRLCVNPNSTVEMSLNQDNGSKDGSIFNMSQSTWLSPVPQPASTDPPLKQTASSHLEHSSAPPAAGPLLILILHPG